MKMIISHVRSQTIINHNFWIFCIGRKDCSLYDKQKNTKVLGNTRFIFCVEHDISRNKSGISAHPCIASYIYFRCLEMPCQASVDYLKQILLSTMLKIFQTHVGQNTGTKRSYKKCVATCLKSSLSVQSLLL